MKPVLIALLILSVTNVIHGIEWIWMQKMLDSWGFEECNPLAKSNMVGDFMQCMENPTPKSRSKRSPWDRFRPKTDDWNAQAGLDKNNGNGQAQSAGFDWKNMLDRDNDKKSDGGWQAMSGKYGGQKQETGGKKNNFDWQSKAGGQGGQPKTQNMKSMATKYYGGAEWPATTCDDTKKLLTCLPAINEAACLTATERTFFDTLRRFFQAEVDYVCPIVAKVSADFKASSCKHKQNIDVNTMCYSQTQPKYKWLGWPLNFNDHKMCNFLNDLWQCESASYKKCPDLFHFVWNFWDHGVAATPCNYALPKPSNDPATAKKMDGFADYAKNEFAQESMSSLKKNDEADDSVDPAPVQAESSVNKAPVKAESPNVPQPIRTVAVNQEDQNDGQRNQRHSGTNRWSEFRNRIEELKKLDDQQDETDDRQWRTINEEDRYKDKDQEWNQRWNNGGERDQQRQQQNEEDRYWNHNRRNEAGNEEDRYQERNQVRPVIVDDTSNDWSEFNKQIKEKIREKSEENDDDDKRDCDDDILEKCVDKWLGSRRQRRDNDNWGRARSCIDDRLKECRDHLNEREEGEFKGWIRVLHRLDDLEDDEDDEEECFNEERFIRCYLNSDENRNFVNLMLNNKPEKLMMLQAARPMVHFAAPNVTETANSTTVSSAHFVSVSTSLISSIIVIKLFLS